MFFMGTGPNANEYQGSNDFTLYSNPDMTKVWPPETTTSDIQDVKYKKSKNPI